MKRHSLVLAAALSLCSVRGAWAVSSDEHACCPAEQRQESSLTACCPKAVAPSTVRVQAPAAEPVPAPVALHIPSPISRLSAAPLASPLSAALIASAPPRAPPRA